MEVKARKLFRILSDKPYSWDRPPESLFLADNYWATPVFLGIVGPFMLILATIKNAWICGHTGTFLSKLLSAHSFQYKTADSKPCSFASLNFNLISILCRLFRFLRNKAASK